MYKKGELAEKKISQKMHSAYTPLLISPLFLRSYGAGQVDISYISLGCITLLEVKSSNIGAANFYRKQVHKLNKSALLLESLLGVDVKLKVTVVTGEV